MIINKRDFKKHKPQIDLNGPHGNGAWMISQMRAVWRSSGSTQKELEEETRRLTNLTYDAIVTEFIEMFQHSCDIVLPDSYTYPNPRAF